MRSTTQRRSLLSAPGIIQCPGVYDCLTAKLAQHAGFQAVYMTGAGTSAVRLGYPDLALATKTEVASNAAAIALVRKRIWLASASFSMSLPKPCIIKVPVPLLYRLVESFSYAA